MPNSNSEAPPADFIAAFAAFAEILDAEARDARAAHMGRGLALSVVIFYEARAQRAYAALTSLRRWIEIDEAADADDASEELVDLADDASAAIAEAMNDARAVIADWRDAASRRRSARFGGRQ